MMAIKLITSWATLFQLAKKLGDARKGGNVDEIAAAEVEHENYRQMCLRADEMIHLPDYRS